MPRKTLAGVMDIDGPELGFNEAAARCRGKPAAAVAAGRRSTELQ